MHLTRLSKNLLLSEDIAENVEIVGGGKQLVDK